MTVNKKTSDCTIYAFVGTAILAISLVVAMYVGNDFHQSLFVESIIFVGSNILLWAIFISMVYCYIQIGSHPASLFPDSVPQKSGHCVKGLR